MRLRRGFRALIAGVVFLVLIGALPVSLAAADPSSQPDPRLVITRLGDQPPAGPPPAATATTAMPKSFRFSAQGRLTVPGESGEITLAMNGEVGVPDRLHATLTLSIQDTGSNDSIGPLEVVVVGTSPYVHLTGDASPTGKDIWVLIDNPGGAGSFPASMLPDFGNLPPVPTQTQTLGDETINGTLTTHMRTTVDATALFGGAKNAKPSTLTVDVWTGKSDNFPRRASINGNVTIDPTALASLVGGSASDFSGPPVTLSLALTINFTDLNVPVTIDAPTTFVKLSDVLK
jgi:hypothetical protein